MKLLTKVEPETKVVVKKIEGGSEIKSSLGDLGIEEGTELTLVASEPMHVHVGPISLKVADKGGNREPGMGRQDICGKGRSNSSPAISGEGG